MDVWAPRERRPTEVIWQGAASAKPKLCGRSGDGALEREVTAKCDVDERCFLHSSPAAGGEGREEEGLYNLKPKR